MKRQEMAAQKEAAKKIKGKQVVLDTTNLLSSAWAVNRQTPLGGPARNAMVLSPDVIPHFNLPSYASVM